MDGADFKALETRGFVLVPGFLSQADVEQCREDFLKQPVDANNHNYGLSPASETVADHVWGRVKELLRLVNRNTSLRPNLPMGASYFATGRGIKFTWHQDHESFFSVQNHYDYLNFHIPVVKPRRDKSNLSIVPFDTLERESPATFRKLVRGGATRFPRMRNGRMIFLDDSGSVHLMRSDINRLAYTPELDAGDLLLLRGDMIHQTQDAETERVALSFRAANAQTLVRRSRLVSGGLFKARMMANNVSLYERMFEAFDEAGKGELELLELSKMVSRLTVRKPKAKDEFFRYLLWEKRREHVLLPFVRRTVTTVLADRVLSLDERWRRPVGGNGAVDPGPAAS